MSRRCDLTDIGAMTGNNVSHAQNKSKRRFEPNLCNVTLQSVAMGKSFKLRITAATLRTVDHKGGLDEFLLNTRNTKLSAKAQKMKRDLKKKMEEAAA